MPKGNCEFKATGGRYFVTVVFHLGLFSPLSLGLYFPWALVRLFKLKASHTTIQGKQTTFSGSGGEAFVLLLFNGLLTLITLGLYGPWAFCRVFRWKADHTLVDGTPSRFSGTGGGLFVLYLVHLILLPMVTFGFYYLVGMYRFHAWKEEHTLYGGKPTSFGAGLGEYIKICLLTWIVNSVTFALFTPWSLCMLYRWQIDGLIVGDKELVDHFPPVHTGWRAVLITFLMGLLLVAAAGFFIFEEIKFQIDAFHQGSLKEKGVLKSRIVRSRPEPLPPKKVAETPKKAKKSPPAVQKAPPIKPKTNIQDLEKKLERADLSIKENPENEMAYYNRAFLYASKGEFNRAIKDYTEAIRINPNNADAYYNRGMAWVALKNYDKAVRDFGKVVAIKPSFEDAYCNRGNGYYSLGKYDLAVRDYDKALKINPGDGDVYFNRGLAYLALKQRGKALSDFERALQLGQKQAEVYLKQTKDQ
ncbi:MAG: DUF898 family protein [Deltaproteobacteria bacterium]|nr:DUF898 family protein [Deltaproteobacteria bacterium]